METREHKRECPVCKRYVYHANERSLNRALEVNRPCRECANSTRGRIKKDELRDNHYDVKNDKWFNICPSCKEMLFYDSRKTLKRIMKLGSGCYPCAYKKRNDEFALVKFNPINYDESSGDWFKTCKRCSGRMIYANYHSLCASLLSDCICKHCARTEYYTTNEGRVMAQNRNEVIRSLWADPNSTFNSDEFRQTMSANSKASYEKFDTTKTGICSPENREWVRQWIIENVNDPDSNFGGHKRHQKQGKEWSKTLNWRWPNQKPE